jgi:chitin disaccharide deacetylase
MQERFLVVSADDFGASRGVNRGIVDAHTKGVVTSTSLMVTGPAVDEAARLSREHPDLSIGLHWDVIGEDEREFDTYDLDAVRREFTDQVKRFEDLIGRGPTHIDSHRHIHRQPHLRPVFHQLVEPLGVPLRDDGRVQFVGDFYAQWEWQVTELSYVSVDAFVGLLDRRVPPGWTEFACHPGYVSDDYSAVYLAEREVEVQTLTDPRLPEAIVERGITLVGYRDWPGGGSPATA